jgi:Protein of unknown function (DUF3788)
MERPFADGATRPTESALESTLGHAFGRYRSLLGLDTSFSRDWNYSKTSGWMLKVHDGKKALFYLIPLDCGFKVSLAIRESERDVLMADPDLAALNGTLASAKKFSEGFGLQFDVDDQGDFTAVEAFMTKLIAARR